MCVCHGISSSFGGSADLHSPVEPQYLSDPPLLVGWCSSLRRVIVCLDYCQAVLFVCVRSTISTFDVRRIFRIARLAATLLTARLPTRPPAPAPAQTSDPRLFVMSNAVFRCLSEGYPHLGVWWALLCLRTSQTTSVSSSQTGHLPGPVALTTFSVNKFVNHHLHHYPITG